MSYVFLSYARVYKGYVDELASCLKNQGVTVWQDTERLRFGEVWSARVNDAIRGSSLVVFVTSSEWYESQPCQNEAKQASYYNRPIYQLSVDPNDNQDESDISSRAAEIVQRLHEVSPVSDLTASVETSTERWIREGRKSSNLLRGSSLHQALRLDDTGQYGLLTENARRYVCSSKRHRRFTLVRLFVFSALSLGALLGYCQARTVSESYTRIGSRSYANSLIVSTSPMGNRVDPYLVADVTLQILDDEGYSRTSWLNDGYSTQLMMRAALDAVTPTARLDEHDALAEGFAFPEAPRTQAASPTSDVSATLNGGGTYVALTRQGERSPYTTTRLEMPSFDLAFSPDGSYLAVLGGGGIVILDGTSGAQLLFLNGTKNPENSTLAWSPDSTRVSVRHTADEIFTWTVRQDTTVLTSTERRFVDGEGVDGGERIAFLAEDGSITLVNTASETVEDVNERLEVSGATDLAVGSGSEDFFVVAQSPDAAKEPCLYHVDCARKAVDELSLPDGLHPQCVSSAEGTGILAVGCADALLLLDASTGEALSRVDGLNVTALAVGSDGRVYVGLFDGGAAVLEPNSTKLTYPEAAIPAAGNTPHAIAVGSRRALFVGDGTVRGEGSRFLVHTSGSWKLQPGLDSSMTDSTAPLSRSATASSDGSVLACGLADGSVILFFDADGYGISARHELGSELRGLAISPSNDCVIGATEDGRVVRIAIDRNSNDEGALRERLEERVCQGTELGLYQSE